MTSILVVSLILLACPFAGLCQDAAKPIPAEWLDDGRLVVSDLNFSVSSPPKARWTYTVAPYRGSSVTMFTLYPSDQGVPYWVAVVNQPFDDTSRRGFVAEMQRELPEGWKVQDVQYEQASIPVSGSSHFRAKCDAPGEPFGIARRVTLYQYGYSFSGKYSYLLYYLTPEAAEPADFSRFVASFALISPGANAPQSDKSHYEVLGGIVVIVLWIMIRWGIRKSRQGQRQDPGRLL
jgi:hypothetical protein